MSLVMAFLGWWTLRLLRLVDAPVGKRARIECFTEIVFQKSGQSEKLRPDGLIIVT